MSWSRRSRFLFLLGALAVARPVRAEQPARTLGLDDVLSSVERAFPLLKAAELEQAVAAGDRLSAEGAFDVSWKTLSTVTPIGYYDSLRVESTVEKPTTIWGSSAFAGWKLGTGDFAVYDGQKQTLEYGELRAGINVPLWRNGPIDRRRASLARAELGTEVAKLSVKEQRIQVRRAAAHRYWAWVASGERLRIAEALVDNLERRDAALGARVARGDLPPVERTDNARALEQRRAQVALAQRGLEQAAIELGLFLRDAEGEPSPPSLAAMPSGFPALPVDPTGGERLDSSRAQSLRPEAKKLALQLRQTAVELDWAKNQLRPGIDIQLAASQDLGRSIASRPDLSKPVFEATLLLDIPLQTRAMSGRADAASAMVSRLHHQQRFARDRIDADVRDAHSAIRRARERIDATRREVKLAMTLEDAERTRFEQSDSQLLIVNIREQQTAEAELREVDAVLDYHRAAADLKAALGE